jgi:NAD(P) transhydrogenase subunit alpha
MYSAMPEGSVIVDLAAESGGNVEGSKPGEIILTEGGIRIWGGKDVPSQLPFHASSLYSRNLVNLLLLMVKDGGINIDFSDEIIDAAAVTHGGVKRTPKASK